MIYMCLYLKINQKKKFFLFQCKKSHLTECPDFNTSRKCPRGKKCPLSHRKKNKEILATSPEETTPTVKQKQNFGASFISFEADSSIKGF